MNKNLTNKTSEIFLKRNEKISKTFLNELALINKHYTNTKNFNNYIFAIQKLFQLNYNPILDEKAKYYLAGFLEGEASLSVGVKKNKTSKFKLYFDPEFNITQSINGFANLYLALLIFKHGRIRFKSGSNATFVFTIDNRQVLESVVIPFYEKYIHSYGCNAKKKRTVLFKELLIFFRQKSHLELKTMVNEIIPRWDQLRVQINQSNQTFKNKEEAIDYVKKAVLKTNK